MAAEVDERELVGFQSVGRGPGFQVVPAVAGGDRVLGTGFLGHLEEQQVRQLGNVLMIGDSVILENVAKVPEPGNDVGGNSAHRWLMFSLMTRYRRVLAAVGASETTEPGTPPAAPTVLPLRSRRVAG